MPSQWVTQPSAIRFAPPSGPNRGLPPTESSPRLTQGSTQKSRSDQACLWASTITLVSMNILVVATAVVIGLTSFPALAFGGEFGPSNPFFAPSTLPFQAPPFDKIKDEDYQPAMEAGMAEERKEIDAIANNPAPPTFENTIVAMEKSGQLLRRVQAAFFSVSAANTNPARCRKSVRSRRPNSRLTRTPSTWTRSCFSAWRQFTRSALRLSSIPNRCAWLNTPTTSSYTREPTSAKLTRQS